MASSGVFRRVAFVRTDVSEELSASIIRVTGINELGKRYLVTAKVVSGPLILVTLMMERLRSLKTSVLKTATRRNISEDAMLHSHGHKTSNLT
jgi:hypothetical protein